MKKLNVSDFIVTFLCPMLVGKVLILYFGGNYSIYPGEGYGYGLAMAIGFTVFMFGRLLWKYKDYEED